MKPHDSVCLLVQTEGADVNMRFLGTCFPFRSRSQFLTAAHCLSNLAPEDIGILSPEAEDALALKKVEKHPDADLAILSTTKPLQHNLDPFPDHTSGHEVGEEFVAFGFPEDVFSVENRQPVARLFKGHFQRFFAYSSHQGFRYFAGELSVGCPAGLSGGPVYRANDPVNRVDGVVTENLESSTVLESIEDEESGCEVKRVTYKKVINYGLCVMLYDLKDWLDENAPTESA
jgi:hypothetical protein